MRVFASLQSFWQSRRLRLQLMIVIAAVGLLTLLLNGVLLNIILNRYFLEQQGTQMAQQAEALVHCCQNTESGPFLLTAPAPAITQLLQVALTASPGRHIVIIDGNGDLHASTPLSAALLQTLLEYERQTFPTTTSPHWKQVGSQIIVTAPLVKSDAIGGKQQVVGEILLAEDQHIEQIRWIRSAPALVTLSAGATVVLILLGGSVAAHVLAQSLGKMTEVVQDIASGNYTRRVTPVGPAEIRTLGLSFNRMVDEVLHQQKIERDLLANISHELASPLGLIRGYAEALLEGVIDDEAQRLVALRAISTETLHLVRLSGDLLDLTLLETGQIALHYEHVPVDELLAGLYERFRPLTEGVGIFLLLDVAGGIPLVYTDGLRLEQVLVNLLNNALHYTPRGGCISLSARHDATYLQLKVSDTGAGIPQEQLASIWERFYQVDASRVRRSGTAGVGLGLAICRSIIMLLSGHITVESTLGEGTTFTLFLPIRPNGT